jgi:DNA-binding HxlR family transcriptional regulator
MLEGAGPESSAQEYVCTYSKVCPIEKFTGVINRRWYLLVLFSISQRKKIRFNDLLRMVNLRPQTLSRILKEMEDSGFLIRDSFATERPPSVFYSLNDSGEKLVRLFRPLMHHAYASCDKGECALLRTTPARCILLGKANGILDG